MPDDFSMFDIPNQPEPKPEPKATPEPKTVTMTEDQLNAILNAQADERRRNSELMAQMFQGRAAPQAPATPELGIDLTGLPDPRDDLDGYHKGLAERLGQTVQAVRRSVYDEINQEQRSANEQMNLMNDAWSRLGALHPELAEFPEIVENAATQVFSEMRQRNVEPMRLLTMNMDDVVNQVAERGQQIVDRIRGKDSGEDEPGGRTRMLDGAGPKPRGKSKAEEATGTEFVDSIKKLQSQMRIY